MLSQYQGAFLPPGMLSPIDTVEATNIIVGRPERAFYLVNGLISGAARDAGNTSYTSVLRAGLVMGIITSSGKWAQYDNTATDGTQIAKGILMLPINTQLNGADNDRHDGYILVHGNVMNSGVCIAANTTYGLSQSTAADLNARIELARQYIILDDDLYGALVRDFAIARTKTADYTVVKGQDQGVLFSTAGASGTVVFSLPAATVGQRYRFRVGAAQELRIDPNGTETISLPSTGVPGAAGKYLTADAAGETVELTCVVAGTWSVFGYTGTWTAEA